MSLIAGVIVFFALIALLMAGKDASWRRRVVIGSLCFGLPVIIVFFTPVAIFIALFVYSPDILPCPFGGQISNSLSYRVAAVTAFGGQEEYEYVLFKNPRSFPIVRKEISTGLISLCTHPALNVNFAIDSVSGLVRVECKELDGTLTAAIPLDQLEQNRIVEVSK
ncbi:MAG: hypothetical protein ABSD67_21840 [Terracidiphilus sp.]